MQLRLIREPTVAGATLGCLFVDGHFACFTLEDPIREIAGAPVEQWKVPGETAIPAGRYVVRTTWSPRFQRLLPELVDVPGFTGIRIHAGNRPADTAGCLLVGVRRAGAAVLNSTTALAALQRQLADDAHVITIENPPAAAVHPGA